MTGRPLPSEFAFIARFFAPLAAENPGALALLDDGALIRPAPGAEIVVTVDMLIAGVHFLADDPPDLIARKLLRVNLSDLAAMGATPRCYLIAMAVPKDIGAAWMDSFAAGLAQDQAAYGVCLAGGDTTATSGPLTLSLTALGEAPVGEVIRRSTAAVGDDIYVSGTVGDAALAVARMQGEFEIQDADTDAQILERYRLPRPRVALGPALRGVATAAIDLSDGLVADLGHICETSAVAAEIGAAQLPLSPAGRKILAARPDLVRTVLTGGDDYELLFTADPGAADRVAAIALRCDLPLTRIGRITAGSGVRVVDDGGREIDLKSQGYRHF